MRIGTIGYNTSRGLGHLVRDFYTHGIINDVFIVKHPRVPNNDDWYPDAKKVMLKTFADKGGDYLAHKFCQSVDVMLFFETPFNWDIIPFCKKNGIKTFLVTMYECTVKDHPPPDRYICPSLLDMEYFPLNSDFLVLPTEYPWKLRTRAKHFIHNGGYLGLRGREGTRTLIEAMQYVKSPIDLTIRVQENVDSNYIHMMKKDNRINYIAGSIPYEELYATGDVAIVPQKFNGCSLPLQEACCSGMMVMTTDRFPMNTWLPKEPLIPVASYNKGVSIGGPYLQFDEAIIDPKVLAAHIDNWYDKDITVASIYGRQWAEQHSWEVMKPKWMKVLSS